MQYFKKTYSQRFKKIFTNLIILFLLGVIFGISLFIYIAKDLPRPEVFSERQQIMPTKIYDRTGKVLLRTIYEEEKRIPVDLEKTPQHVIDSIIATEDARFYQHHGLDYRRIAGAILFDIKSGTTAQGASTITQQLIRSTFLNMDKTATRKIREIVLSLELEKKYSKDQILEWYLNQVSMGPNIYGIGEAASAYFNKGVEDLTIEEGAIIAAMIRGPSYYYPYGDNLDKLLGRKDYVLKRMYGENYITKEEYDLSKEAVVEFEKPITSFEKAPHFILEVESYLLNKYGTDYLREHGLKVYTTLNVDLQEKAEKIVKEGATYNMAYNAYNASLVAIDPHNGQILSMVGSKDYFGEVAPEGCIPGLDCKFEPSVNVSTFGQGQQPGSSFKPFAYVTAFELGADPEDIVIDQQTNFGNWGGEDYIPENYDGLYRGRISLRNSLAQSLNIPAVKTLLDAGLDNVIQTAKDLGISTLTGTYGPSLVLGAGEVKLVEMVSAFGVFSAEGLRAPQTYILRIEDLRGNVIESNHKTPRRVLSQEACQKLNDVLSDNDARTPMFGPKSVLYFPGHWVAAKTGTTNGFRDSWTIGYTKDISIGVWAGNNDNTSTAQKPGSMIAGPIWNKFMWEAINQGY
jgi:membrane peptidoglycan carboxypeptidase